MKLTVVKNNPDQLLVTVDEAAQMLGVCNKTVRNEIQLGELTPIKFGRAIRLELADLRALISKKRKTAISHRAQHPGAWS